jgi:hypothetical protein
VPKPAVFGVSRSTRCMICLDKEMSDWVKSSLDATLKEEFPRPSISRVHKELVKVFGERSPRHETSLNRHLSYHEPAWNGWPDENS